MRSAHTIALADAATDNTSPAEAPIVTFIAYVDQGMRIDERVAYYAFAVALFA